MQIDITKQKNIEIQSIIAKKQIEQLLSSVIARMPGSVYWKDMEGRILGCNQFMADLVGVNSPQDLIGKTGYDFFDAEIADVWRKNDEEVITTGKELITEEPVIMRNGEKRIHYVVKVPLRDQKKNIEGIIGISFDITDLKHAELANEHLKNKLIEAHEALLKANKRTELFAYNLSTRTRSLLTVSDSVYQSLKEAGLPENYSDMLSAMNIANKKILHWFDHVVDFLKLEDRPPSRTEIQGHVVKIAQEYARLIKDKPIVLLVDYDRKLPDHQIIEIRKVQRILRNLLANAINYTQVGMVKIEVTISSETNETIYLAIKVIDTGRGIPPENLSSLFNVFETESIQDQYKSGGLILSLTHMFAQRLKGDLTVESEVGKGTEFTLTLPVLKVEPAAYNAPERLTASIRPIVLSDNPYLVESLDVFVPLKDTWLIISRDFRSQMNSYHYVIDKDTVLIIDGHAETSVIKEFIQAINKLLQGHAIFVVLVSPKENENYNALFLPTMTVLRVDFPFTPLQFENQWVKHYYSWLTQSRAEGSLYDKKEETNILLIEDQDLVRHVLTNQLQMEGCEVVAKSNGESGLQAIEPHIERYFDLILLDVGLPGISGLEVARKIRKNSVYKKVPIIAQTAFTTASHNKDCFEAGIDDVLPKPVSREKLREMLNKYVWVPRRQKKVKKTKGDNAK